MELRVNPKCDRVERMDWAPWEAVYNDLEGPRFQFLRVLYINIGRGCGPCFSQIVETSKDMVARHPLLATRGVRVALSELFDSNQCVFCLDNPWN
jgi:hypothetical protein